MAVAQEVRDVALEQAACLVSGPTGDEIGDDPVPVDHEHRRDSGVVDAVGVSDRIAVDVGVVHSLGFREGVGVAPLLPRGADDFEPLIVVRVVETFHRGDGGAARPAPRRPEIEDDDFPAQRGERDRTRGGCERPLRRGFARCGTSCRQLPPRVGRWSIDREPGGIELVENGELRDAEVGRAALAVLACDDDEPAGEVIAPADRDDEGSTLSSGLFDSRTSQGVPSSSATSTAWKPPGNRSARNGERSLDTRPLTRRFPMRCIGE